MLTTKNEFSQNLDKIIKHLDGLRLNPFYSGMDSERKRLDDKRKAVEESLAMWLALTATAADDEISDAAAEFEQRLDTLATLSKDGYKQGYNLVLSFLKQSEFLEAEMV